MPTSPRVTMDVTNNSLEPSTPSLGISFVAGITTKGPMMDPSKVIRSLSEFREIYGYEVVPDNTASIMERALAKGSLLRVCSIGHMDNGQLTATHGIISASSTTSGVVTPSDIYGIQMVITGVRPNPVIVTFNAKTRETGGDISTATNKFITMLSKTSSKVTLSVHGTNVIADVNKSQLSRDDIFSYIDGTSTKGLFMDSQVLQSFISSNKYIDLVLSSVWEETTKGEGELDITPIEEVQTLSQLYTFLDNMNGVVGANVKIRTQSNDDQVAQVLTPTTPIHLAGVVGSRGAAPDYEDWISAMDTADEYSDFYEATCSHIHQHLDTDGQAAVHVHMGNKVELKQDYMYYIEVPKTAKTKDEIIAWKQNIGQNSKMVAYFAGGNRIYNSQGQLTDSDVMGTILALGAVSATNFGPWYSIAGQNRGVIPDSQGPVAINYGGDSKYDELNDIASESINIVLIKNTKNAGRATMLWHNFTSSLRANSERFLNVERLVLYVRKNLKPILESYIEEPNNIQTWSKIWMEVTPFMNDIQTRNGINAWDWQGDQFASNMNELTINNVQDVKAGKYRAILTMDEVVSMQQIQLSIVLDTVNQTIEVEL